MRSASRRASALRPIRSPSSRIVVRDVGEPRVLVVEHRNAGAVQPRDEVALRAVDDDEIRLEREDALEVRIDQRADARPASRPPAESGRSSTRRRPSSPAPIANSISVTAGTREMIRRGRRSRRRRLWARLDARGASRLHVSPSASAPASPDRIHARRVIGVLKSNQRKNGPPMSAVMMPTGSSSGANTVRASASQATRNARAEERRRRQHEPMIGADDQPHQMRHDDADEADRAADRHRRAGRERRAEERHALRAHDVDAARAGRLGAEAEQVERPREPRERDERDDDERQRRENRRVARDVEIAHQPAQRAIRSARSR